MAFTVIGGRITEINVVADLGRLRRFHLPGSADDAHMTLDHQGHAWKVGGGSRLERS